MRINARQAIGGLMIAGVAGGLLFLPAIEYIGSFLAPTQPAFAAAHVRPLVGDALWAAFDGGRASTLQPINPFSIARFASCNVLAEITEDNQADRERRHEECLPLMSAIEAVSVVSNAHLKSQGVSNDPRVPFVGLATMNNVANKWSRAQLLDALAERAQFSFGFHGVDQAAQGFFGLPADALDLPRAALLAGLLRNRHLDPWCGPVRSTGVRRRVLEKMRDNRAIDDAAFQSADTAPLELAAPPADHKPCEA